MHSLMVTLKRRIKNHKVNYQTEDQLQKSGHFLTLKELQNLTTKLIKQLVDLIKKNNDNEKLDKKVKIIILI
jgi:hypothetical protein